MFRCLNQNHNRCDRHANVYHPSQDVPFPLDPTAKTSAIAVFFSISLVGRHWNDGVASA
jgi:hypothetical protein